MQLLFENYTKRRIVVFSYSIEIRVYVAYALAYKKILSIAT